MFGILIQPNSIYCGISLDKIELPEQCALMGILRQGKIIPSEVKPSIYAGDYILAIAIHPMMVPALKVTLKKTHRVYHSLDDCPLDSRLEFIKHYN
jgi:Trk K+ transport system NAD-binding subunit